MQGTEFMAWLLPAGLVAGLTGLAGEYARRRSANAHQRMLLGGLTATALVIGLILLTQLTDWPIGIALWLGLMGIAGFAVSFAASIWRNGWPPPSDGPGPARPVARSANLSLTQSLFSILNATVCALLIMLALTLVLPLAPADRALASVVIWPLLWAGLSLYLLTTRQYRRTQVFVVMVTLSLAMGAALRWIF